MGTEGWRSVRLYRPFSSQGNSTRKLSQATSKKSSRNRCGFLFAKATNVAIRRFKLTFADAHTWYTRTSFPSTCAITLWIDVNAPQQYPVPKVCGNLALCLVASAVVISRQAASISSAEAAEAAGQVNANRAAKPNGSALIPSFSAAARTKWIPIKIASLCSATSIAQIAHSRPNSIRLQRG